MAHIRDIKRRIRSVKNIQQITHAMKLVAAAKLQRAQHRLLALRPYSDRLAGLMLRVLGQLAGDEHPLLKKRKPSRICILVVTGDRGLCGSFNMNILRAARTFIDKNSDKDIKLVTIGKKGYKHFRKSGWELSEQYFDVLGELTFANASRICDNLIKLYTGDEIHALYYIYSEFVSPMEQRPRVIQILPFELSHLERRSEGIIKRDVPVAEFKTWSEEKGDSCDVYLFEPFPERFCHQLLIKYMRRELYRVLLESVSSEYGARMSAMDNATDNAVEMIETLTLDYNRARQAAITRELSDIVGGAEAMK